MKSYLEGTDILGAGWGAPVVVDDPDWGSPVVVDQLVTEVVGHGRGGPRGPRGGGMPSRPVGAYRGIQGQWRPPVDWDIVDEDEAELLRCVEFDAQGNCLKYVPADLVGYVAPETKWYTVATPGAIKDEMDRVLREGETLNNDINASRVSDPNFGAFRDAWISFWTGYKKFYDDNASGVGGWVSRTWSATGDQVVSYGNQLNDWRARLSKFSGARVTEPAATAIVRREDENKKIWVPIVISVVAIVGLFGIGYALSKAGAFASLFKKAHP